MGAEDGGGVRVAGAAVAGAARGEVARPEHLVAWEGCRACTLPAGNYLQKYVNDHAERHKKKETADRKQRDMEAKLQAEAAAKKKSKNWVGLRNKYANKY